MPIVERQSARQHLNAVQMSGAIALSEIRAHNDDRLRDRATLTADAVYHLPRNAHFTDLTIEALDAHRARLRRQLEAAKLPLIRRTAWLCESRAALPFVQHFLSQRGPDDGLFAAARLTHSLSEAADWLMTSVADIEATLATGRILARFDHAAPAPSA